MISLIKFTKPIILKEEAIKLDITWKVGSRFGFNDGKIERLGPYDKVKNIDAFPAPVENEKEENEPTVWVTKEGKKVESYYLYDPLPKNYPEHVDVEGEHLVNLDKFLPLCKHEFSIIRSVADTPIESVDTALQNILSKVENKVNNLTKLIDSSSDINFNQKCNVHVGGGLLVTFNELCLKEDICTDELQIELNDGWRILAVCVQPDQRRPDYILGRYNPKLDTTDITSAKR